MIILAGILNIFIPLSILIQVVVALLLILVVLMQRPKQEGLGATFGSGVTDQMFGAQTTNVLQKATVWLAIIFVSNTVVLTILNNKQNTSAAISAPTAKVETVKDDAPSLADQLSKAEESTPASAPISSDTAPTLSIAEQLSAAEEVPTTSEEDSSPKTVETIAPVDTTEESTPVAE